AIEQRLTLVSLTGLKQQRRAATRKRERLGADHPAQLQRSGTNSMKRDRHKPIRRFELSRAARTSLMIEADDQIIVQHEQPFAVAHMDHVHGRRRWLLGSSRSHRADEHYVPVSRADANAHFVS